MWLFVETTRPDNFVVGLLSAKTQKSVHVDARSHAVLGHILKLLTPSVRTQLEGICVVSGPGSFTSTRTGVMIANILSRQLQLPLVGVTLDDAQDLGELTKKLISGSIKSETYIAPVYSSEPNITVKTC